MLFTTYGFFKAYLPRVDWAVYTRVFTDFTPGKALAENQSPASVPQEWLW